MAMNRASFLYSYVEALSHHALFVKRLTHDSIEPFTEDGGPLMGRRIVPKLLGVAT
jgi:hypothetical protein